MIKDKVRKLVGFLNINKNFKLKFLGWAPVVAFVLAVIGMNTMPLVASAFGQVQSRSIEMSSSVISATNVSYQVNFYPATTGNIGGIDIDFCTDPIIGDACTIPTGFSTTGTTTLAATPTGFSTSTGSWAALPNAGHNLIYVTNATAQTESGVGTYINFTITTMTNPSTLGTFYARILTFDTQAHANAYTSGSVPGAGITDAGGIALSTVAQITITSKVQESITFCIYTSAFDITNYCSAVSGTSVALGDANSILSSQGSYTNISTKYDIQTNALHSVTVRMTGTTLTSGSNLIESSANSGTGSVAATAYASTSGAPQFGVCDWEYSGTSITPSATYNGGGVCNTVTTGYNLAASATFGLNLNGATGIASTYGDPLAVVTPGPIAQGEIAFLGNISNTTPAGIYTATMTFIATGSY